MASFKIYKLHFTSPLHISDQHEDYSSSLKLVHSDTLYAALASCMVKMGSQLPADGNLGFSVSSMFPYYQHDKNSTPVYFLPMPMHTKTTQLRDVAMAKKVKKVQWVDSTLYGTILAGQPLSDDAGKYLSCIQESYLTPTQLPEDMSGSRDFVISEVSERVALESRIGDKEADPYYVDKIIFRFESGLYFIANGDTALLDKALNMLSVEGLGSYRNVGMGVFDYTTDEISIDLPEEASHQVALSLFIPKSEEQLTAMLDSDDVAYDFVRRGGWITTYPYTTIRKNAIYAFLPGSVFCKPKDVECVSVGKIVNLKPEAGELTPDHPIWRNGKSIMLPINIK